MALLRNGTVLNQYPMRQIGGGVHADITMWGRTERRNLFVGSGVADKTAAVPNGHLAPSAWLMPIKPGGMASVNNTKATISATANGVMGFPITGDASFSITAPDANAELIAFGQGSATVSLSAEGLLSASVSASGSAGFSVAASALLGAEASISGATTFSFSANATILPLNDASPLRTGSAAFSFSGNLSPYAIGIMEGSTVDTSTLSPKTISAAVWQAAASEFSDSGTMGNKLNGAAAGGVDYTALADAVWQNHDAGRLVEQMTEVWGRLGLDPTKPLVTGETQITFGDIVMAMTGTANQTTVTRQ